MKKTAWTVAAVAAIAVLAIGAFVLPAPDQATAPGTTEVTAGLMPGAAALRATINPETGAIEISSKAPKTTLDIQTLESLRRDTEGLKEVVHPNGAVSVNLEGRFQSVSVARIDKNGKLIICTEDDDQIEKVINGEVTAESEETQTPEVQ